MSPRRKENFWLLCIAFIAIVVIFYSVVELSQAQPIVELSQVQECKIIGLPVVVNLDDEKNNDTIAHARAAVIAGQPRILHIARALANAHRDQALRGFPRKHGFDRDEYPPAASNEGGRGADIEYVEASDNRSAGSRMKTQLKPYCDGQAFILEPGTP